MGNNRRLTKGRRRPFTTCAHRGFGVICHRCAQAEQLEVKANELAQFVKNKGDKVPSFVVAFNTHESPVIQVSAGGRTFFAPVSKKTTAIHSTVTDLVHRMREYATHLKKAVVGNK